MSTIAIGDIHGCISALERLIEEVDPGPDDTVVTLGDYVNRGPASSAVLDFLIELEKRTRLVPLRGNHDLMMQSARESPRAREMWVSMGGAATLRSYPGDLLYDVPARHWRFLDECEDWYETDSHIFVHGGVDADEPMEKQRSEMLLWSRVYTADPHHSGKTVICGHTAQESAEVFDLGHTICIDTACVYGGWLTALDVETRHYWQANNERWARTGELPTI